MPPPESIMISDDEPDPQQTLSRDMEALDEKVNEVNKMVVELGVEVSSYAKLLKAAQSRLDRARQQKEHLVDEKHRLLDKKQKLMQLSASHKLPRPLAYGLNHVKSNNVNGHIEPGNEPKPKSPAQSIPTPQPHDQLAHSLTPVAANAGKRPRLGYFGQPPITKPFSSSEGDSEEFPSIRKRATNPRGGRGRRPRRLYGGLNGVRASISSRALRTPSEEKEKSHRTRNVRAHVYSPYYEASSSESVSVTSLSQKKAKIDATLTNKSPPRNIPANPRTFSRKEISSIIGGRTQGT